MSHRGPLFILVVWIALALLAFVWLGTDTNNSAVTYGCDVATTALFAVYGISLIFKGSATYVRRRRTTDDVSEINCYSIN